MKFYSVESFVPDHGMCHTFFADRATAVREAKAAMQFSEIPVILRCHTIATNKVAILHALNQAAQVKIITPAVVLCEFDPMED